MAVKLVSLPIPKPEAINLIVGQARFIKMGEDLHEALVTGVPGIADPELAALARVKADPIGAGHSFLLFFRDTYPLNVSQVPEVCGIYGATSNPVEVIVAETATERGILGVVDGWRPKG